MYPFAWSLTACWRSSPPLTLPTPRMSLLCSFWRWQPSLFVSFINPWWESSCFSRHSRTRRKMPIWTEEICSISFPKATTSSNLVIITWFNHKKLEMHKKNMFFIKNYIFLKKNVSPFKSFSWFLYFFLYIFSKHRNTKRKGQIKLKKNTWKRYLQVSY